MGDIENIHEMVCRDAEATKPGREWFPVGSTIAEWQARSGGDPVLHEDTLLLTARGVFACGMIGAMRIGARAQDGSVIADSEPAGIVTLARGELVLEASDTGLDRNGCRRLPSGALVCRCGYPTPGQHDGPGISLTIEEERAVLTLVGSVVPLVLTMKQFCWMGDLLVYRGSRAGKGVEIQVYPDREASIEVGNVRMLLTPEQFRWLDQVCHNGIPCP